MSIPADDWNNRLKEVLVGIAGMVPKVGGLLKFLITQFWPTDKDSIWDLLKDKIDEEIYKIVDAEILKNELAERESELKGLKDSMNLYVNAQPHEKGSLLSAMLVTSNTLFEELAGSVNDVHFLPLGLTHACQHLSFLRERVLYGKDIYEEDNTPIWKKDLDEYLKKYQDYFLTKKEKWEKWRNDQISTDYYTRRHGPISPPSSYCDITDKVANKLVGQYVAEGTGDTYVLKPGVDMLKSRVLNEIDVAMIQNVYLRVFELGWYIPGHENDPPLADKGNGVVTLGPFSVASGDGGHDIKDFRTFRGSMSHDSPGRIAKFLVREYNSIDAMQFFYDGHAGTFVGNPSGGEAHQFDLQDDEVVNFIHMGFANGLLVEVQFKTSKNQDTGKLGNRSGWVCRYKFDLETSKMLDDSYSLRCINIQEGSGPSSTTGVCNVKLTYYHKSLLK